MHNTAPAPTEQPNRRASDQPKRRFLVVTNEGLANDLAWQLTKEGNEVKMYVGNENDRDIGDGFVEKVEDWKPHVDWAEVVIFDDTGWGKTADAFRAQGKLVVGGSVYADKLELDREFGQSEMKAAGMTILPHWDFTNFDEAIVFLTEHPGRYVFKPTGQETLDWEVKNLLFVGQEDDGKDLLEVLVHNKKTWSKKMKQFQLQKYASGVEIAVGAFFNGNEFVYPINVNFEHKKMFPGDIGPYTGEMGTLMFWAAPNSFFTTTLGKMQERLAASKYVGYIDINCIANARGIYPLEFTARFGYPTISIQMEGVTMPWGELLHRMASGESFEIKTKKGFQVGVVVAMPPFPWDDKREFAIYKDSSIIFKKPVYDGIHLGDIKLVENDWKLAGQSGYVLIVTGSNSTVENARRNAYRRIENIMLQNMFYRTDIGEKWFHESDKLQTWGVL